MKTIIYAIPFILTFAAYAKEGAVQCGNLIYAGTKTSKCFSDEFLSLVQQKTSVATERRFKPVKLGDDELFKFPFVIMTGEGDFTLTKTERENMKKYLESGGFILASASCSSSEWADAFEREITRVLGKDVLQDIDMKHSIFKTIFTIETLGTKGDDSVLKGYTVNNKLAMVYTRDGLNDTANADGCCCCGGSEIRNSVQINANILAYSLLH
jgi:hypothetical protein